MSDQEIGSLVYKIEADVAGFGAKLKEAEVSVKDLAAKMKVSTDQQTASVFKGIAAWDLLKEGVHKATEVISESIQIARRDLVASNETRAILEAQGKSWDDVGRKVSDFSKKMLQFGIDDEEAGLQVARFSQRLGGDLKKSFETTKLAADLSASGFGSFKDVSEDLERILSGKGAKALVKYGVALESNATIAEQLNAVTKRVSITAEQFANSTEGQFAKISQAQEELKSAMGKGVLVAFSDLITKVGGASGELMANDQVMKGVAKTTYELANGLIAIVTASIAAVQGLKATANAFSIGKDKLDIFSAQVVRNVAEAGGNWDKVAQMDAKIASINKNTDETFTSLDKLGASVTDTFKFMASSLDKASGSGFDELTKKMDESDVATSKARLEAKELTQAQIQAAEAAKGHASALESMQKSVLDTRDKVIELASSLKDKLTQAFDDFKSRMGDEVAQSTKSLTDITLKAETNLADVQKQLAAEQAKASDQQDAQRIIDLNARITEEQKILTASAGFETRLKERVIADQKTIDDLAAKQTAETDPVKKASLQTELDARKLILDQVKQFGTFDKTLADARKTASMDEFSRAEVESFKRIELAANEFITQTKSLREKLEIANGVEDSITKFYAQQTNIRQTTLDAFATSSIATLKRVGAEAQAALSSLSALQSNSARAATPTGPGKAMGGFTVGGEMVHANEWVMPSWMVRSMGGLVSQLEGVRNGGSLSSRTVNAPVTINANVDGPMDFRAVGREMAWELGRL